MTEELTIREQRQRLDEHLKDCKYNLEPECVVVTSWNLEIHWR